MNFYVYLPGYRPPRSRKEWAKATQWGCQTLDLPFSPILNTALFLHIVPQHVRPSRKFPHALSWKAVFPNLTLSSQISFACAWASYQRIHTTCLFCVWCLSYYRNLWESSLTLQVLLVFFLFLCYVIFHYGDVLYFAHLFCSSWIFVCSDQSLWMKLLWTFLCLLGNTSSHICWFNAQRWNCWVMGQAYV